jgi:RNA polymerase sigma factor (sigma-70 family)
MPRGQLRPTLRQLWRLNGPRSAGEGTDAELLERYISDGSADAFTTLVRRHARLVRSVCWHVLQHEQDVDDAFQATFLVFAARASSIRKATSVASWLHGVAYRTAMNARRIKARKREEQGGVDREGREQPVTEAALREVQAILDGEVNRLPQKNRVPFVLCCLEGKSKSEVAQMLGWRAGTVSSRLAQARKELRRRLRLRGVSLSAALCAVAVARPAASAVPAIFMAETVRAALSYVSGKSLASAKATALAKGVSRAMFLKKCKGAAVLVLVAAVAIVSVRTVCLEQLAAQARPSQAHVSNAPAKDVPDTAPDAVDVAGRVLDPDGKPVAAAKIYLSYHDKSRPKPKERATSDSDGRFQFTFKKSEVNPHYAWFTDEGWRKAAIVAVAPGFGPQWVNAGSLKDGEVTLHLVKDDVPIVGRVLNLEGKPVVGATVRVISLIATLDEDLSEYLKSRLRSGTKSLTPWTVGLTEMLTTGDDGRFRLTGLGRERVVELDIGGPTLETVGVQAIARKGLDEKALNPRRPEEESSFPDERARKKVYGAGFDHMAGPTKPFEGTVREKGTGKPLAGIRVGMVDPYGRAHYPVEAVTDAKGHYRLVGWPKANNYRLIAARDGDNGYLKASRAVGDTAGVASTTVDFELIRGVVIEGRVRDKETGKPVRGYVSYAPLPENPILKELPDENFSAYSRDAENGTFRLIVPPGPGLLRARNEDGRYLHARLDPADKAKGHTARTLYLESVQAYRLISPDKPGESLACDFELIPGKSRRFEVVGPDDKPVTGVSVFGLRDSLTETRNLDRDESAGTALGLDPESARRLTFLHADRKLAGHVTLRGNEAEPVRVKLEPWGAATGRVLDPDGKPLADAKVEIYHRVGRSLAELYSAHRLSRERIRTDAEGGFRVDALVPGIKYEIVISKRGLTGYQSKWFEGVTVESGKTTDLGEGRTKSPMEE